MNKNTAFLIVGGTIVAISTITLDIGKKVIKKIDIDSFKFIKEILKKCK